MDDGHDRIGLVGDVDAADAVRDAGGTPVTGDADDVLSADPEAIVAVGEAALTALARHRPDVPVLPVDAGAGVRSVAEASLSAAVEAVVAGDFRTQPHPLLSVTVDGIAAGTAFFDAALVAAEPARISAFELSVGEETLGPLRADGVVLATPAGTSGYAARLGAPAVAPETGVLAVEPVAQFATTGDRWVVPDDGVTATVTRDEVDVAVLADDVEVATVGADEPVTVARDGHLSVAVVPESPPALGRRDAGLEKH